MSERRHRRRPGDLPPPGGPGDALAAEERLLRDYARTRDENAREELVRRFLPFARSLAMRYSGGVEPSDDLIQVASLGLVSALERYDPERGVPFAAFAGPTILGELRRHFRDRVWTLRVPRGLQESIRSVEDAITKLSHELERSPTVAEIAEMLEIGEADVLEAFEAGAARRLVSLDRPTLGSEPGDEAPMAERIGEADPGFELVEDRAAIDAGVRRPRRDRARGAEAALRRGPDPVEDRRAGRLLADARLPDPAPGARQAARRGRGPVTPAKAG